MTKRQIKHSPCPGKYIEYDLSVQEVDDPAGKSTPVGVPAANQEYWERFEAPEMASYGQTIGDAWACLVLADQFLSLSTERLLASIAQAAPPALTEWSSCLLNRYAWQRE